MITREQYLEAFDRMINATDAVCGLVPADKLDWVPKAGMLTCGQQMIHMAAAIAVYATGIQNGVWPSPTLDDFIRTNHDAPNSSAPLALRVLRRSYQALRTTLLSLSDADMQQPVFSPQFGRDVPRWQLVILCMEHHLTHKAELFLYLRLLGIDAGTRELYYGRQS